MIAPITSLMLPIITKHFLDELDLQDQVFPRAFNVDTISDAYVQTQSFVGYQPLEKRERLAPVFHSEAAASFALRIPMDNYGICDIFAMEDIQDRLFEQLSQLYPRTGGGFARASSQTMEIQASNYLISQFSTVLTSNYVTADGLPLFGVKQHPISSSSTATYTTSPTIPMDISYAALKFATTVLENQSTSSGAGYIKNYPKKLIFHPNSRFEAKLVLDGEYEPNTANRNKNYIKEMNIEPVSWAYFKISGAAGSLNNANNAWVLLGDTNHLNMYIRENFSMKSESVLSNNSQVVYGHSRFGFGVPDSRGIVGSAGL